MSIRVLKLERATQIRGATFNNVMITAKMNRMTLLKAALRIDRFLPKKLHRDVRNDHRKNEDEHRGCRPVSSVEILKDLTIGVQTDDLGRTPRSTSRRRIDNIKQSEIVDDPENDANEYRVSNHREFDPRDNLVPLRPVHLRRLV